MICMNGSKNPNINSKYYNKMFKADNQSPECLTNIITTIQASY